MHASVSVDEASAARGYRTVLRCSVVIWHNLSTWTRIPDPDDPCHRLSTFPRYSPHHTRWTFFCSKQKIVLCEGSARIICQVAFFLFPEFLGFEMADVLDILEFDRDNAERKDLLKKKPRPNDQPVKKAKGFSREVYALLCSDNKDSAPLISSDFSISGKLGFPSFGYKKAKANLSLRKVVKWTWTPFTNPARNDGFQLHHWRREMDKNKEYPFAKMNVSVNIVNYTDAEYQELLQSNDWSRAETDYLMKMCRKFDLRFVVIQDQWDKVTYKQRSVEDIKDRYYFIYNTIAKIRNESTFSSTKQQICIYDADHERKRKAQLIKLYNRTPTQVDEEQKLIADLRKIEQRKKEREKKTQDLQKLITAADSTAELRRNEQQQARNASVLSRSSRKKTSSQVKNSRFSDIGSTSQTPNIESAGIKFPESKAYGVWLRSSRMKLPTSVGQKRVKAIDQMLNELKIEQHPMPTEEICQRFNDLRSDIVFVYELKMALNLMEFELQALKHQVEATETEPASAAAAVATPVVDSPVVQPSSQPELKIKEESTVTTPTPTSAGQSSATPSGEKKISEVFDVTCVTPRKRKAAIEQVNLMKKLRKN